MAPPEPFGDDFHLRMTPTPVMDTQDLFKTSTRTATLAAKQKGTHNNTSKHKTPPTTDSPVQELVLILMASTVRRLTPRKSTSSIQIFLPKILRDPCHSYYDLSVQQKLPEQISKVHVQIHRVYNHYVVTQLQVKLCKLHIMATNSHDDRNTQLCEQTQYKTSLALIMRNTD